MQSDKTNNLLVDSVHLEFGPKTVLQSAFMTARTGKVTGVLKDGYTFPIKSRDDLIRHGYILW